MRQLPWISACIGGGIGIMFGMGEREGSFIAGICAAAGYFVGALITLRAKHAADARARQEGSDYSANVWDEYKKKLRN